MIDINAFIHRSTSFQFATIGAEIGRAITWRRNPVYGDPADCIARATTYLNIALTDPRASSGKRSRQQL